MHKEVASYSTIVRNVCVDALPCVVGMVFILAVE